MSGLFAVLLSGLLLFTALLHMALIESQPTDWDALGYQVAGSNIARGAGPALEHPFNEKFGPYFTLAAFAGQRPQEPARLYLNYPPGFPLLLAAPQWLGLPDSLVPPVLSVLSLVFVRLLGGRVFDRWTGLLGAALIAFTPAFLKWGTSFWADLPGTCFMLGSVATYLIARRRKERASQLVLGGIAGVLVVVAIFIKYSNVLVLLPLLAYALFTQRKSMFASVANWAMAAPIIAGLIAAGLYNYVIYGNPLETHYSASRSGWAFPLISISYALGPSPADGYGLLVAVGTLWENFSWLLIAAVVGFVQASGETRILLGGMFLVFLSLSSTYAWAPKDGNARYLLPLFAPVGLFAARGCLAALNRRPPWKGWASAAISIAIGVTLSAALITSWPRLVERNRNTLAVQQAARSLTANSEQDAVFLAYAWNDAVNRYGGRTTLFYRRMNINDPAEFKATLIRTIDRLLQDGLPVYYVEDSHPSLMNSLPILQANFHLHLWKNAPVPVYQVSSSP